MNEQSPKSEVPVAPLPDFNAFEKQSTRGSDFLDFGLYGKVHFRLTQLKRSTKGGLILESVVIDSPNHAPGTPIAFLLKLGEKFYIGQDVRQAEFAAKVIRHLLANYDPEFNVRNAIEALISEGRLSDEVSESLQAVWERKQGKARKGYHKDTGAALTGHWDDDFIHARPAS